MLDPALIPSQTQHSWSAPGATELSAQTLFALFQDRIPFIRLAGAVTPQRCERLARACEQAGFDYYDDIRPPVGRIGVTQYEYRHRPKHEYFEAAREAERKHTNITHSIDDDPLSTVIGAMRAAGVKVGLAREIALNLDYGSRLVRQIPMAKLHMDYAPLCAQGWDVGRIQDQITLNLYLRSPERGGDCVIYNRAWQLADDQTLEEVQPLSSYGYPAELVRGFEAERISPMEGDIVLFNTRNFHEVESSSGSVTRLSLTTFFGRLKSNEIVFWS